jgi:hypothetical protein
MSRTEPDVVTLAEVDSPCERVMLPGRFADGELAPCTEGDHEHTLRNVMHMPVVPTIQVGNTVHVFL